MPEDIPLHQRLFQILDHCKDTQARPDYQTYFMAMAVLVATRSPCQRQKVGCVLVSGREPKNRILSTGYNGFLQGHPHLSRIRDKHEQATIHAEQNAIAHAARHSTSLENATAYITHFPCVHCTKMLLASGISGIFYHQDYCNDPIALELLEESHTHMTQI